MQTVFRRFAPELDLSSTDIKLLEHRIAQELPRFADGRVLPAVVTLPPEAAVYSVQHAKNAGSAVRAAAAEMLEGQVDHWPLNEGLFATYTCPGPVASGVVKAVRRANYDCTEVIAHPLALRYAARLAGHEDAVVLDWGWRESVLTVPTGPHSCFSRKLNDIGLASIIKRASGVAEPEPMSTVDALLLKLRSTDSQRRSTDALRSGWEPTLRAASLHIQQTLQYSGRFTTKPPTRMLVCGIGAMCDFAVQWLHQLIDMPVERWSMPDGSAAAAPWAVSAAAGLMPEDPELW